MPKIRDANKRQCNHCAKYFDEKTIEGAMHLASCRMHNGYKNYETWAVALWIDNDQGLYSYWRDAAKECRKDAREGGGHGSKSITRADHARYLLADRLKEEVRERAEEGVEGMAADLLGSAFDEVDWDEIARNMLDE